VYTLFKPARIAWLLSRQTPQLRTQTITVVSPYRFLGIPQRFNGSAFEVGSVLSLPRVSSPISHAWLSPGFPHMVYVNSCHPCLFTPCPEARCRNKTSLVKASPVHNGINFIHGATRAICVPDVGIDAHTTRAHAHCCLTQSTQSCRYTTYTRSCYSACAFRLSTHIPPTLISSRIPTLISFTYLYSNIFPCFSFTYTLLIPQYVASPLYVLARCAYADHGAQLPSYRRCQRLPFSCCFSPAFRMLFRDEHGWQQEG
jgi:hypothetical protein